MTPSKHTPKRKRQRTGKLSDSIGKPVELEPVELTPEQAHRIYVSPICGMVRSHAVAHNEDWRRIAALIEANERIAEGIKRRAKL